MKLLEAIRAALRRAGARKAPWPDAEACVDLAALRSELDGVLAGLDRDLALRMARRWSGEALPDLMTWLVPHLLDRGLARDASEVHVILQRTLTGLAPIGSWGTEGLSPLAQAELEALWEQARQGPPVLAWDELQYAERLGLCQRGLLLPRGQVLLRLSDRDALAWVMTLEVRDSLGDDDPWRLDRSRCEALLERGGEDWWEQETIVGSAVRRRLAGLGLVNEWKSEEGWGYGLTDAGRAALEVATTTQGRWAALAAAVGPDPLEQSDLPPIHGGTGAASALARMVVHEIRNTLFPAGSGLKRVRASLEAGQDPGVRKAIDGLQADFARLERFVDWLSSTAGDLGSAPERFSLVKALKEAASLANGGAITTKLAVPETLTILGVRHRLVVALVNLLRNARQHAQRRVALEASQASGRVMIYVDDDGPGVPEGDVVRVFLPDFSTQEGVGHGFGLAAAKEIIEVEHRGAIAVGRSPMGGARFTVSVPL